MQAADTSSTTTPPQQEQQESRVQKRRLVDATPYFVHVEDMDHAFYRDKVINLKNIDASFMGARNLDKAFATKVMGWLVGPDENEWFSRDPYKATGWAHLNFSEVSLQLWSPSTNISHTHLALRHERDHGFSRHDRLWMDHITTAMHITFTTYGRSIILSQVMYDPDRVGSQEERFALAAYLAIIRAHALVRTADENSLACPLFEDVPMSLFNIRMGDTEITGDRFDQNQARKRRAVEDYYDEEGTESDDDDDDEDGEVEVVAEAAAVADHKEPSPLPSIQPESVNGHV